MHTVSLLEEILVSLAKQGKAALQKLAAWADRVWAHYCADVSDSSLTLSQTSGTVGLPSLFILSKTGSDRRLPRWSRELPWGF